MTEEKIYLIQSINEKNQLVGPLVHLRAGDQITIISKRGYTTTVDNFGEVTVATPEEVASIHEADRVTEFMNKLNQYKPSNK